MPTNPNIPLSIPLPGYIDLGGMLDRAANARRLALQDQDRDEDRALRREEIELRRSKGQREAADEETMRSALKLPTRDETLNALRAAGDPRVFEVEKAYQQADELKARTKDARLKAKMEEKQFLGFLATQVEGHLGDQDGGVGAAMEAIREAQDLEIEGVEQIGQAIQQNPAALPEIVKRLKAAVMEPQKPQPMMNVGPGSTVFDPNTKQPVFTGPQRPETPSDYTLGDTRYAGGTNKPIVTNTRPAATGGYQWAVPKEGGPAKLMTPEEIRTSGARQADTADMRNKDSARGVVGTAITAIEDIGKRVISKVGPAQRADALKRGAAAVLGNDPEWRTYRDARFALAGNLAVAQQGSRPSDADIERGWLPLVPDVFSDTAESAAMKWKLIRTLINQEQADPAAALQKKLEDAGVIPKTK